MNKKEREIEKTIVENMQIIQQQRSRALEQQRLRIKKAKRMDNFLTILIIIHIMVMTLLNIVLFSKIM